MEVIEPTFTYEKKFTPVISKYNSMSTLKYLLNKLKISEDVFQYDTKNTYDLDENHGKYFQLKNEFGNIKSIFVGADLSSINLNEIYVGGHDLTGANLSGQDLRNIDLTETIIRGANLSHSNLEGKNLSGLDLRGVNFSYANLRDTNLEDAIIGKTIQFFVQKESDCFDDDPAINFIKGLKCMSKVVDEEEIRTKFTNADLTNAKFGTSASNKMASVTFSDFSGATLTNSNMTNVRFTGCDFQNSKFLNGVNLDNVYFVKANFNNAEIKNFNFTMTLFQDSTLIDTTLANGIIDQLILVNSDFSNADLSGTNVISMMEVDQNNLSCKNNPICKN